MIRVAVLDDHPAVLAGLRRLVERSPDLEPAAFVATVGELQRALDDRPADVVVLDYDLARGDGLAVCLRLKERVRPPRVVVYSAYAGPALAMATRIARADGLVDKSEPISVLLAAVRGVAAGDTVLPAIPVDLQRAAMSRLADEDVAVAAMLLAGTSHLGVAEALGLERQEVAQRARRIVACVSPHGARADDASEDPWVTAREMASARSDSVMGR